MSTLVFYVLEAFALAGEWSYFTPNLQYVCPLLWFMYWRHLLVRHIHHFMVALADKKTKGPRKGFYVYNRLVAYCI